MNVPVYNTDFKLKIISNKYLKMTQDKNEERSLHNTKYLFSM